VVGISYFIQLEMLMTCIGFDNSRKKPNYFGLMFLVLFGFLSVFFFVVCLFVCLFFKKKLW